MTADITTADTDRHIDFSDSFDRALVEIGEKFGLYQTIAEAGPATASEIARKSGVPVHHLTTWLRSQARASFLTFDKETGRYSSWCELPGPGI